MPKIDAGSVREHRENREARLLDAAERLLRNGGPSALTAGAVTAEAGIARNSLYRYVHSVEDLHAMVLMRHLPQWMTAVTEAVRAEDEPLEAVLAYVRSNLEQAAHSGHGWLMAMAGALNPGTRKDVAGTHDELGGMLRERVARLDPLTPELTTEIVQGILQAGFTRLDRGDAAEAVLQRCLAATAAVLGSEV